MMCKKYMMVLAIVSILFSACSIKEGIGAEKQKKAEINMEKNTSSESKGKPLFQADLTHDGLMETVEADVEKTKTDSQALINITVKNLEKKVIWEEEIALPHLSQGAYYICRKEEKDFLLYYLPSDTQGLFSYQYKLFYFNEDGEVLLQDEEKLTFVKDESKGVKLPVEKMVSFAEKLNAYMKNSYLLVSTLDGELLYSTEYEKETYTETYQRFLNADEQQDLRSGLKAYQKRINNQVGLAKR